MKNYNVTSDRVFYMDNLTSAGQAKKLEDFIGKYPGEKFEVYRIPGDPRSTFRNWRRRIGKGLAAIVGRSSGCASARGNFHTTIVVRVWQWKTDRAVML